MIHPGAHRNSCFEMQGWICESAIPVLRFQARELPSFGIEAKEKGLAVWPVYLVKLHGRVEGGESWDWITSLVHKYSRKLDFGVFLDSRWHLVVHSNKGVLTSVQCRKFTSPSFRKQRIKRSTESSVLCHQPASKPSSRSRQGDLVFHIRFGNNISSSARKAAEHLKERRVQDSNLQSSGHEPDEFTNYSTPLL
ncbi:disease resistance protein (TIR-NBS-LRR class)family, partial [Striga asiatica]